MNTRQRFGVAAGLVALSAVLSVLAAPSLPETVVTHWSAAGEPNGTMSKPFALAFVPALSAALVAVLAVVPRVDPRGERYASFRTYYDWLVVLLAGFLLLVHAGTLAYNLGYRFDFVDLVLVGIAGLFYSVGVVLPHAEPNWFVGVRTPWTLDSDEVWDRTHALGSRLFKASAVLALVGLLFDDYAMYFLLVPALATAAITVAYSYWLYERLERDD
ncbi:hypothetical protein MBEHAL_2033 [Halarchaeum acidiphilum MH1-52-1]|uniref:DUF1648 domain-containing protein n=1 Tax=Halarchaeum acidiphilum MH1-52-1 TaxID=1261545 RepID=U3AER9_9EURY|nr:SdpI family protein [Halarchaeum acidiphilum]GAD53273.1 hypothetical protein MBEHAL_2033 [Halarchaeum acidiphilum MH1-52-1]